jgi:EAL domain-containing protein (putative c-di-GMP-specific phosphodiesterase class I)
MEGYAAENPLRRLLSNGPIEPIDGIDAVLKSVRTHLGMDVAFVAEFAELDRLFRHVDAAGRSPVKPGDRVSLEVGYCQRVVDGRLPELIVDANALPESAALPETQAIPIGSHLSVPIRLGDGSLYGTFCCFSFEADHSLTARDLQVMRAFADVLADQIDRQKLAEAERNKRIRTITAAIDSGQPVIVFQPIYNLQTGRVAAFETLSRFSTAPHRTPDVWFAEAASVGLGPSLEAAAVRAALDAFGRVTIESDITINVSPEFILSGMLHPLLQTTDLRRVILEITEHAAVSDYDRLLSLLAPLRALGLRIAVDDAGAGYASLRHILAIEPDILKLDISLTRGIDQDRKRRALASALIAFAGESGIETVAEGVETDAELQTLIALEVSKAQGYYLGRPMQLADVPNCPQLTPMALPRDRGSSAERKARI